MRLLAQRVAELEARLEEAEETLRAIRSGEVDALVIAGPEGEQVFTLRDADRPYRAVIETMQEGAVTMTAAGHVLYCNRCFADLVERPLERVLGADVSEFVAEECAFELQQLLARPERGELVLVSSTGRRIPVQLALNPLLLEGAQALCMVVTDLSEQKRRDEEARLLQEMAIGVSQAEDVETALTLVLRSVCALTGWAIGEAWVPSADGRLRRRAVWTEHLSLDRFSREGAELALGPGEGLPGRVWQAGRALREPADKLARHATARDCGIVASVGLPVHARDEQVGVIGFYLAAGQGVDERTTQIVAAAVAQLGAVIQRKQAEERTAASLREKETLLQEVHHRVKNNLQVISSLLRMQARTTTDLAVRRMFEDSDNRVRSMALVHESLYASPDLARIDFAVYGTRLVQQLALAYQVGGTVRLALELEPTEFDVEQAIPLGLIVNELVSNALKHAFPGGRSGTVRVAMRAEGDEVLLVVADDGIGVPEGVEQRPVSMGLQIVRILLRQVEAHLDVDRRGGSTFSIRFPRRAVV